METVDLAVRFGGLPAIEGVRLRVSAGSITALIGPSGAGRSTLIAALAGRAPLRHGEIRLDGRPLRAGEARQRRDGWLACVASGRSLPLRAAPSLFETVAAAYALARRPAWSWLLRPWTAVGARGRREVSLLLETVGLAPFADHPVDGLPLAHRRSLQLALALPARPRLLALDRPWRGLAHAERRRHADLLRTLSRDGLAVLLVEDDLELTAELADQVVVMHRGRVVARGTPAEIGASDEVRGIFAGEAGR